jgi:hypothetical protein
MTYLRLLLICITFCLVASYSQAQNSNPHQHDAVAPVVIDGAVHPELIPDSAAYRLYFLALSTGSNSSDEERKQKQAHLRKTGLQEQDLGALSTTLTEFRIKHDALVAEYNRAAEAATARNEASDIHTLLRDLDELVQSTRDTLKVRLSPEGMTQFDAFVQSEKKHMKVPEEEQ